MKKTRSLHCIVRIDLEKPKAQHCWEVKIIRPGKSFHRSFSDSKFGGRKGALAAAKKCRDAELALRPAMTSYERAIRRMRTNTSGIVGVRRCVRVVRRGNKAWSYDGWAVSGTPTAGGKSTTRHISINQWGVKGARKLAIAQRKAWEKSLRASVAEQQKKRSGR